MHAMAQLRIAQRNAALDGALQYPQSTHAPLCGIDAPFRDLVQACAEIERARLVAYCGGQDAFLFAGPFADEESR